MYFLWVVENRFDGDILRVNIFCYEDEGVIID